MKRVIQLYGGPGTGKSTQSAFWFSYCKSNGMNVELVREYVKNWVWEGRAILAGDQTYITAKQSRLERICQKDLDLIITDSPMLLGPFYDHKVHPEKKLRAASMIAKEHFHDMAENGWEFHHVFLERGGRPYNPKGRYQTEEEAKAYDEEIKSFVLKFLDHKYLPGTHYTHTHPSQVDLNFPDFLKVENNISQEETQENE